MIKLKQPIELLKILKEEKLSYGDYIVPVMIYFKRFKKESYESKEDLLNDFLLKYTNKNLI